MAPGKKPKNRKPTSPPREAPLTDIEVQRMQTILRNNREFQRLGLGQFRAMMNACVPTGAAKPMGAAKHTDAVSENSGSLYEPRDEDMEQAVDKEAMLDLELESPEPRIRGLAASKRVTAIPEARITRKRARDLSEPAEVSPVLATDPQVGATDQELTVANAHTQSDNHNMTHQGPGMKKRRMGKGLERISRGCNDKMKVHITQGKKRLEAPMQAAKLASEAGIIIRDHIPIFPHWKDYMKDDPDVEAIRNNYLRKIAMQFDINIDSQPVRDACFDILKKETRTMRYMLKKNYFNDVPANRVRTSSPLGTMSDEQWKNLVEMWSNPKHKDKCLKAKSSCEQVKLQQMTRSRSYIAHCFVVNKKYKDAPPTAIDVFKETHCSSKKGFSENAQKAIDQMEENVTPAQEGKDAVTPTKAVLQVMPKTTFLQNIGIQPASKRGVKASEVDARVQELENELMAEKEGSAAVRAQVDDVENKLEEERAARKKVEEEHEVLKKQIGEMHGFFRGFFGGKSAPFGAQQ